MTDEHGRELEALRQEYEISIRQLRTLLDARVSVQRAAEQNAALLEGELKRIAEALCPGMIDDIRKAHPAGLGIVDTVELVTAIIRDVSHRLSRLDSAEATGRNVIEMYDDVLAESGRWREESERLSQELNEAQARINQMESRMAVLQQSLESAQRRLGDATVPVFEQRAVDVSPDRLPEWMQKWKRQSTYERDAVLLRVLAETGAPRRLDVAELFAERISVEPRSGSVGRAFRRAVQRGVIELIEKDEQRSSGTAGAGSRLIRLTEQGRDACRLLLGKDPAPSQTSELLSRHKSEAHTLLNLEAADLLRDAGYEVDLFPGQVELPDDHLFVPDLVASLEGQTLFIEVERNVHKNRAERNRKWTNYYTATGGRFCIVVPDKEALETIKSEILFWAGRRDLTLWMINLSDAKGQNKRGSAVWSFKRGE